MRSGRAVGADHRKSPCGSGFVVFTRAGTGPHLGDRPFEAEGDTTVPPTEATTTTQAPFAEGVEPTCTYNGIDKFSGGMEAERHCCVDGSGAGRSVPA